MWSPGPHDDLGGTDLKMGTRMGEGGAVPTPSSWARLGGLFGLNFWDPFFELFGYLFLKNRTFSIICTPFLDFKE